MEIKVLCADSFDCRKLEEMVKVALKELGIFADVVRVSDIADIAKHGILSTPGLVVNGKVKYSGKPLPDMNMIKDLIKGEQ